MMLYIRSALASLVRGLLLNRGAPATAKKSEGSEQSASRAILELLHRRNVPNFYFTSISFLL
jgi:hypothetical protein